MEIYGHSDIYNYAIDEGGLSIVKAERPTRMTAHKGG